MKTTTAVLLALLAPLAHATTWGETSVDDPVVAGAKCNVQSPNSYGSYIYHWSSKYDQVFWPITEFSGIWRCATSGFVAFIGDFDGMTELELVRVRAYLEQHAPDGGTGYLDERGVLARLEDLYALRDKDAKFRLAMLRALAYQYEELGDAAAAKSHRESALALLRTELARDDLPYDEQLEYRFVSAAYLREFGDRKESDRELKALKRALRANDDEKLKDYVEYLSELAKDVKRIEPGGKLAPPQADDAD